MDTDPYNFCNCNHFTLHINGILPPPLTPYVYLKLQPSTVQPPLPPYVYLKLQPSTVQPPLTPYVSLKLVTTTFLQYSPLLLGSLTYWVVVGIEYSRAALPCTVPPVWLELLDLLFNRETLI